MVDTFIIGAKERQVLDMRFVFKMIVFPFWLLTAFLALMLKWTLNLSAFVLALPMLYIFGCGLYTLYCREWLQFLILLVPTLCGLIPISRSKSCQRILTTCLRASRAVR